MRNSAAHGDWPSSISLSSATCPACCGRSIMGGCGASQKNAAPHSTDIRHNQLILGACMAGLDRFFDNEARPLLGLGINAREVAADDTDGEQLQPAEEI